MTMKFINQRFLRKLIEAGLAPKYAKVAIFALTFKENCPDIRNSKVVDIVKRLKEYGVEPILTDPYADKKAVEREYGLKITQYEKIKDLDCIILAVAHDFYKQLSLEDMVQKCSADKSHKIVFIDVKGLFSIKKLKESKVLWWRL